MLEAIRNRLAILVLLIPTLVWAENPDSKVVELDFVLTEGEHPHPFHLLWQGEWLQLDLKDSNFSALYRSPAEDFTGLEHRDGRYWTFNWPKLKSAIEKSRFLAQKLKSPLVVEPNEPATPLTPPKLNWHHSAEHQTIAGIEAELWETTDLYGRQIQVWTAPPGLTAPFRLSLWKKINHLQEVVKLVAVRNLGPSLPPEEAEEWPAERGVPIKLVIGKGDEAVSLTFRATRQLEPRPDFFRPPEGYLLSPLSAIEGIE